MVRSLLHHAYYAVPHASLGHSDHNMVRPDSIIQAETKAVVWTSKEWNSEDIKYLQETTGDSWLGGFQVCKWQTA